MDGKKIAGWSFLAGLAAALLVMTVAVSLERRGILEAGLVELCGSACGDAGIDTLEVRGQEMTCTCNPVWGVDVE